MIQQLLVVEHRDEVFERLAAELAAVGLRVVRAASTAGAVRRYVRKPTDLLLINGDQRGESCWLSAAKLHLTHPKARIWVYLCQPSTSDVVTANFLHFEELIDYQGDLSRLVAGIQDRLNDPILFPDSSCARSERKSRVEAAA